MVYVNTLLTRRLMNIKKSIIHFILTETLRDALRLWTVY